jgi:hypothetical protein
MVENLKFLYNLKKILHSKTLLGLTFHSTFAPNGLVSMYPARQIEKNSRMTTNKAIWARVMSEEQIYIQKQITNS